jgi:hypothetical protein
VTGTPRGKVFYPAPDEKIMEKNITNDSGDLQLNVWYESQGEHYIPSIHAG